ncbi:NlpC/P60 family protein [Qipengyuania nanhaisediminis]|uniref:NlpC/P60 family protein n=1 Tax=Qipengyuania nanhaisediminis TaxID=604088 RepID=UPI0038B36AE6
MSNEGARLAQAAAQFIGIPFRLHGRCAVSGLDCVGLVEASLRAIGRTPVPPRGYQLRNRDCVRWFGCARQSGFVHASGEWRAGDLLVFSPSPAQLHLAIAEQSDTIIHAHAGLKRVVREPAGRAMALMSHWRLDRLR